MVKGSNIITETLVRSRISGLKIQIFLCEEAPESCPGLSEQEIRFGLRHFEMLASVR